MIVLLHWKTSCRDLIRRSHSCQQGANRFEIAHLNSTRHFLRGFLPKIEETFGQSWFVKSWPYQQFRWNQWYWMEFYFYWFNPTHHQEIFFTLLSLAFWKRSSSKLFANIQDSSLQNTSGKQKSIKIPCPSWRHLAFEHLLLDPWFDQQAQKFPRGSHGGKGWWVD